MAKKNPEQHFTENERGLLISLLRSMGITLPLQSKLPLEELDKILTKGFDSAQRLSRDLPELPLAPQSFQRWTGKNGSVMVAAKISNVSEALKNMNTKSRSNSAVAISDSNSDAFEDLRQTILHLGDNFDKKRRFFMIQDEEQQSAIALRLVDVHVINKDTPVFIVVYERSSRDNPSQSSIKFLQSHLKTGQGIAKIKATIPEQRLLLRLLRLNSTRLDPNYSPERDSMEGSFELSFLLPLGPVAQPVIAKLVEYPGCIICGQPNKSKCAGCLAESYCSRECQRIDWPEHKKLCKSVAGGEWTDLTFIKDITPVGYSSFQINRHTASDDLKDTAVKDLDDVPPKAHGKRPFLIKMQKAFNLPDVLIYDRQRSIQVHVTPSSDKDAMEIIEQAVMKSPTPGKIYRWAKRTGDFTLSVCLDKEPQENCNW